MTLSTRLVRNTVVIAAGLSLCLVVRPGDSQERAEKIRVRVIEAVAEDIAVEAVPAGPAIEAKPGRKPVEAVREKDLAEERFPGGAPLKTDPELQRLVARSDEFVKENRHDLAAVLWQKVLDEAGDSLMTRDGRLYTSVRNDVERTLAQLPKAALMAYRITADGEAQAVVSRNEGGEEGALGEVVRRFFLSSQGDDAAYRLACLALDRRDFVAAARHLQRILTVYPDPSVPRGEMLLRLAFAADQLGDQKTVDAALAALKTENSKPSSSLVAAVTEAMAADAEAVAAADAHVWPIALGNPQRTGHMPALPREMTKRTMSELWVQETPLNVQATMPNNPYAATIMLGGGFGGRVISRGGQKVETKTEPASREQIVSQWRNSGWMPTSQLLFDQGRVFAKTCDMLVGFNRAAPAVGGWESVWRNSYELDGYTQMTAQWRMQMGMANPSGNSKPRMPLEILLFGDHVQAAMSISDGLIFSIEGKRLPKEGNATPTLPKNAARGFQYGVMPRRTRENWLACYEAKSGKTKWHRPASDEEKEGSSDVGFLCAPVPFADSLLTAVTDGGTIWLYAISREDGRTLWKSYLCDEPNGGCSPWSTVGIAIDGSEAYVVCGTGVVFAIDAAGGAVHWAVRYPRDPVSKINNLNANGMAGMPTEFKGWDQDTAVVLGRTLLVMASDCDKLLCLDRRSGTLLWESPRVSPFNTTASYCVGVVDRGLIVAGRDTARRYDIPSGKLVWERELDKSFARGAVTSDTVYLPVKDSVLVLDAKTGEEISQVGVKLTTGDPVGNLYSDGEKLWVTAPGRIFTLTNLEQRLAMLDKEIESGSTTARLNRMRLYAKTSQLDAAVADLTAAYAEIRKASGDETAQQALLDSVIELKLSQKFPAIALNVLTQTYVKETPPVSPSHATRMRDMLAVSLTALRNEPQPGAVAAVLGVLPLLDQDYLLAHASTAVATSARPEDQEILWQRLESKDRGSAVALTALARLAPDSLKEKLTDLRQAKDERLRLAAARVALNLGERVALSDFLGLMKSEDAPIRLRSYQALRAVSGQVLPFNPNDPQPAREKQIEAWEKWIGESGGTVALKLPLGETDLPLGRTLVAFRNQIIEVDDARTNRWSKQVINAWVCQGLPNGNRLIGIYGQGPNQHEVRELNDAGEVVGKPIRVPSGPLGLQRLTNGNTLVSCTDVQQVLEYTPEGEVAWQMQFQGNDRPMGVQRLDNGNTLIGLSQGQRVVEVDRDKKIVWEARNVQGASSVSRLDNGNTLVAEMFTGRVIEFDPKGTKIVWKKEGLNTPRDARRLPNGNTLIAENNGVQELDPQGNTKWRLPGSGASCISVY